MACLLIKAVKKRNINNNKIIDNIERKREMKKVYVYFLFSVFFLSSPAFAADDMEMLKNELKKMSQTMEALQKKIDDMEKEKKEEKEEVQYLSERVDKTEKYDAKNEFLPTNKFHLNMKAKVNNNLSFAGRLAAYKVWGDSSGIKTNTGSLGDVTLDGNTS
jgi:wobble nucleotide-excising tRNase